MARVKKGVRNRNRPKKRGKASKARRARDRQTRDFEHCKRLRLNAPRLKNKGHNLRQWRERMASMKQNHSEPVSQDISLRMESMEQNQEEPVSENISEDLHNNCIQEDEDYWKQEEAGPSNVKPPYVLKESKMLVNVAFFVKSLQGLNNHGGGGCNFSNMYITGETIIDCNVGIELSCTMCLTTAFVWTDDPGPEFLEQHPPKPFTPAPKKTPVVAEKVPPKQARVYKRKTPPPPRPPRVPRLKSIRQNFIDYYTSNSIDYQFTNDVPFIKQEIGVPEDVANPFLNQSLLSSTQPATVQLLFGRENANDMPLSSDENVSFTPGATFCNNQTSSAIGLNTGHSVITSANETIVPDVTSTEVLPVDLNLVKTEVQEESQSMEVDNLPSVRILPMSVTSINHSETALASESFTETSKDSTLVTTTSVLLQQKAVFH
ncbi:hypothetical protein JTE90_017635 [Oedothorax gibbosus]|uniref:Uncharacterized protein n=1 Tax=Oedothorax gibbosus TaxID=931172 RepID=A0AAV6U8P8_9ARAC|nr:hypothetical protein JTE90_017635 [Oedothorax gibbosus]